MKSPALPSNILPATKPKLESIANEDIDVYEVTCNFRDTLCNISNYLKTMDMMLRVYPYQDTEPDVVATLLGVEALGLNTLTNALKNGFMVLRNFFLKLRDATVAFFKYLFDANSRVRRALAKRMNDYNRSGKRITANNAPTVALIGYSAFNSTCDIMDKLFIETQAVYKAHNKEAIGQNCTALKTFGYDIQDYRVINTDTVAEFPKMTKPLLATDADWGWSIQALTEASNKILVLSSKAEKLNYIKEKINNSVKSATYAIDRLNMIGNADAAIKVQNELNETAVVSGYLFNCAAVFQKKIDYLASQLIEAWTALNTVDISN